MRAENGKPTGFALLNAEERKAAARKGGKSVPAEKRTFSRDRDIAQDAGSRGGRAVPGKKRTFAKNPLYASEMAKKGRRMAAERRRLGK